MCIIYRMRNDCLCWLYLVTIHMIRDWLPQVTELLFCTGIELGRCTAPSTVFSQPYGKKRSFGVLIMVSRVNAYSEKNLMHGNTDNISHVPNLTWPGVTSSLTSNGSVNDITQQFSLNSFLCYHLIQKCLTWNVDGKFWGQNNFMEICPLFQLMCPSYISSSQFCYKYYYIRCIKWCKC